jgi:hypothetical protein
VAVALLWRNHSRAAGRRGRELAVALLWRNPPPHPSPLATSAMAVADPVEVGARFTMPAGWMRKQRDRACRRGETRAAAAVGRVALPTAAAAPQVLLLARVHHVHLHATAPVVPCARIR